MKLMLMEEGYSFFTFLQGSFIYLDMKFSFPMANSLLVQVFDPSISNKLFIVIILLIFYFTAIEAYYDTSQKHFTYARVYGKILLAYCSY